MQLTPLVFVRIVTAMAVITAGCDQSPREPASLEELISYHLEARGGLEKLETIETITLEGHYLDSQDATPFTEYYSPPYYLAEARMFGRRLLQAYDGKQAWWKMPPLGIREAVAIPEDDFRSVMLPYNAIHFGGLATTSDENGGQARLVGREDLDGRSMYKVHVVSSNGLEVWHHIDPDSFREARRVFRTSGKGSTLGGDPTQLMTHVSMVYSDYRDIDGVMIPHRTEYWGDNTLMGTFVVDQAEFNRNIDLTIFHRPDEETD